MVVYMEIQQKSILFAFVNIINNKSKPCHKADKYHKCLEYSSPLYMLMQKRCPENALCI